VSAGERCPPELRVIIGRLIAAPAQRYCENKMNDEPQRKPVGRPFSKGDRRINKLGRPKHFNTFRRLAQQIAGEDVIGPDGNTLSRIEMLLRQWSRSKSPVLQKLFVEIAFGPPPQRVETTGLEAKTVLHLHYAHEEPGYEHKAAVPPAPSRRFLT
jgi:hypothetical protein